MDLISRHIQDFDTAAVVNALMVDQYIPEHIEYLEQQYRSGHFQLSGRKVPRTGGVILATVPSRKLLDEILSFDPFKRENLAEYEVIEMVPSRSSEALAFLIDM